MLASKLSLETPVSKVPMIGPAFASRLSKLGIATIRDLLWHVPARYEDYSLIAKAATLQEGETVTIQGKVMEIKNVFTRNGFMIQQAKVEDETGIVDVIWFNQRFLTRVLHKGDTISLSGKVQRSGHKLQLESPDYEVIYGLPGQPLQEVFLQRAPIHTGRFVPVYSETAGITSKWLRSRLHFLLQQIGQGGLEISDHFSDDQISQIGLIGLIEALREVHFPTSLKNAQRAKERLAFDEMLFSQLEAKKRKEDWQKKTVGNKFKIVEIRDQLGHFVKNLSFELTSAQKKVIDEIYKDLAKQTPMNRLLQGDVGSGKTVVAALAMLAARLNGYQSALMAPTEILANQHYQTLQTLLKPLKIGVGIATGSKKDYTGFDVIVGTHALLTDKLNFSRLGFIVIDEQHRFGVGQRAKLTAKGINPHVLTMTAPPIPRTVALTLYGDLDLSLLDEMPKNRRPVRTWVVPKEKRTAAYQWIRSQHSQAFIVCPLIEESESETLAEVKAAKTEYERLQKEIFPDLKLGLLHGRLKPKEKDAVLTEFRNQKLDILVATPVVEVGIDIPQATIMLIEAADRFGLAQLHQLRGRVGRGDQQSFCLLFTESEEGIGRLKYLEKLTNGLQLAEIDLKFRGPGQRFGTAQHGRWDLKIADFADLDLVEKSNLLAQKALEHPEEFPLLHKILETSKINIAPN